MLQKVASTCFVVVLLFVGVVSIPIDTDDTSGVVDTCGWKPMTQKCAFYPTAAIDGVPLPSQCVYPTFPEEQGCKCDCSLAGPETLCPCNRYLNKMQEYPKEPPVLKAYCPGAWLACPGWDASTGQAGCESRSALARWCFGRCEGLDNPCVRACAMDVRIVNCTYDGEHNACVHPIHETADGQPCQCKCEGNPSSKCVSRTATGEKCGRLVACPGWDPATDTDLTKCTRIQVSTAKLCSGSCPSLTTTTTPTTPINPSTTTTPAPPTAPTSP